MQLIEALAVAFGIVYLLLAVREHRACWYAAAVSTALSVWLFWSVSLPMESALNVYYLFMAGYGWWQWRQPGQTAASSVAEAPLAIRRFSLREHSLAITTVALLTLVSGTLLHHQTAAALPFLDSFTTWGSVITTWMVARKILENWLYWLVIDSASILLYLDRELYLYAGLFALYLVIAVFGWLGWRRSYRDAQPLAATAGAAERGNGSTNQ
ncbi:MAG: nicotinamide riboside transporter PnuC [Pseudomonadota bacterium]